MMKHPIMTTSLALALALPSLTSAVHAQDDQSANVTGMTQDEAAAVEQQDALVARVGSVDIRTADVMAHVGMMPERVRAQPPEMLIPMAVEQLVLRQLILQQATTQELATDPEVQALADDAAQAARENVLVQFWLERELEGRVTPEDVQAAYDAMQSGSEDELPPLDEVRGQVEQSLRQQEVETLSQELLENDLVVYYGPDGQPVESEELTNGDDAEAEAEADSD